MLWVKPRCLYEFHHKGESEMLAYWKRCIHIVAIIMVALIVFMLPFNLLDVGAIHDKQTQSMTVMPVTFFGASELVINTVAGSGNPPSANCNNNEVVATSACLDFPFDIAVSADGGYYFSDAPGDFIYHVRQDGTIHPVAGNGICGFSGDGGQATQAQVCNPEGIALGSDGSLYFADWGNHRIRRIGPTGIMTTIAGTGAAGAGGDGGLATLAQVRNPLDVTVAPDNSLYIADANNHKVRRIDASGVITTVAGTGTPGFGGDGSAATQAMLNFPEDVAISVSGTLYIADTGNNLVRFVGVDGLISTVVGTPGQKCSSPTSPCGDGGAANQALLSAPTGVNLAPDGSLYIVDADDRRIRLMTADGMISKAIGSGQVCSSPTNACGDGGPPALANLGSSTVAAQRMTLAPDGSIYVTDGPNRRVRRISTAAPLRSVYLPVVQR